MPGYLELDVYRHSTHPDRHERKNEAIRYSQDGGNFRLRRRLASISHNNGLGKTGKFFVTDGIIQLRDTVFWKGKGFS